MARYLLIESRDPFESVDAEAWGDLAMDLAKNGDQVTMFLVQNGVLTTRPGNKLAGVPACLQEAGVQVLADEFSLRERGIATLVPGVQAAPIDVVIDELTAGAKAIWH